MIDSDEFLNPDTIKSNLMLSALYLAAYELLKDAIIDNIRDFFTFDYRDGKAILDKQYKTEVTSQHKDCLYASSLWLQRNGVITVNEIKEIQDIRKHRNQVAHELPKLLLDPGLNLNVKYFRRIRELLKKIEVWWIKNVQIPANPDFDGVKVDEQDIHPGRVIAIDYIISAMSDDYPKQ